MDYNYIIEVAIPDSDEVRYLGHNGELFKDPKWAARYPERSETATRILNNMPRELNARLVDSTLIIGTYISPFPFKRTRSGIWNKFLETLEDSNILIILSLPILLPIMFIVSTKDKIKEYVATHR